MSYRCVAFDHEDVERVQLVEHELRLLADSHRFYNPDESADDVIRRGAEAIKELLEELGHYGYQEASEVKQAWVEVASLKRRRQGHED